MGMTFYKNKLTTQLKTESRDHSVLKTCHLYLKNRVFVLTQNAKG